MVRLNKLDVSISWSPESSFKHAITHRHGDMLRWFVQHRSGAEFGSLRIDPIPPDEMTPNYVLLLSRCSDIPLLMHIYKKIKADLCLPDVVERCIIRRRIEIAHHIVQHWPLFERLALKNRVSLTKHAAKANECLMLDDE